VCGGGERHSTSSIPTPLSNSTSQRLFAAFLVRFAGGGEGVGRVAVVGPVAVRPAGAQAGSGVLGAATALQH
jgi:hypothetical protein